MKLVYKFLESTPFLLCLVPLISGILLADVFSLPPLYPLLTIVACLGICGLTHKKSPYVFYISAFLVYSSLGFLSYTLQKPTIYDEFPAEASSYYAILEEPPKRSAKSVYAIAEIEDEQVMLYFHKDSLSQKLMQGDRLLIHTKLNPIDTCAHKYGFNYSDYLYKNGVTRAGYVAENNWKLVEHYAQSPLYNLANYLRNGLLNILREANLSQYSLALAEALVLGYKIDLDPTIRQAYSNSGAMHVLAVSGLHVGIIYAVVSFLLKMLAFFRRHYRLQLLLVMLILWLYAMITGLSPSVLRATIMLSFILIGQMINRPLAVFNNLFASAFLMLVVDPSNLFSVGFQLSYCAVIGILSLYSRICEFWSPKNSILKYIRDLLAVSIAAQIGTLPISLFYFHQFPTYFIFTNIIVVPGAAVVIAMAFLLFLLYPTPAFSLFAMLYDGFLNLFNGAVFFIESLPFATIFDIRFHAWEVLMIYACVLMIILFSIYRSPRFITWALSIVCIWLFIGIFQDFQDIKREELLVSTRNKTIEIQHIKQRSQDYFYYAASDSISSLNRRDTKRECLLLSTTYTNLNHAQITQLIYKNKRIAIVSNTEVLSKTPLPLPALDVAFFVGKTMLSAAQIQSLFSLNKPKMILAAAGLKTTENLSEFCTDNHIQFLNLRKRKALEI